MNNNNKDLIIFYADDDEDDRDTFSDAVGELSDTSTLITHDGGAKLLAALKNPPPKPSIVFIDLNMPGKTGFDVLKEIRTSQFLENLPVIVVSTSSDEKTIESIRALGANLYITKPTNFNDLKKSIDYVLNINWANFKPDIKTFIYRNN